MNGAELYAFFAKGTWDIVHLAMYVDARTGDLIVPEQGGRDGITKKVIPIDGVDTLIRMANPRLVIIVTCDSLVLAARLARHANTIAGTSGSTHEVQYVGRRSFIRLLRRAVRFPKRSIALRR